MSERYSGSKTNNTPTNFAALASEELYNRIAYDNDDVYTILLSGDVSDDTDTNTIDDANAVRSKMEAMFKIRSTDVSLVGYRPKDFKQGNVYSAWSSGRGSISKDWYSYVPSSGMVYVCLRSAGNPYWRWDKEGRSSFTNVPGGNITKEYSDGSVWTPVQKMDFGKEKFKGKYLPFSTIDDEARLTSFIDSVEPCHEASLKCGGRTKVSGTCCLYHKFGSYDSCTGVTFGPGDFYKCDCTKCYKCIDLAKRLNMYYRFTSHGVSGGTLEQGLPASCKGCDTETFPTDCGPCECSIGTPTSESVIIDAAVKNKPSTNRGVLSDLLQGEWNRGGRLTMFLNLKDVTKANRKLVGEGPWPINIESNTAIEGAEWSIVAYRDTDGFYYAEGLNVVNYGSGYLDASTPDFGNHFVNGIDLHRLIINITPMAGLVSSFPYMIPDPKVQIKFNIRSDELRDMGLLTSTIKRLSIGRGILTEGGRQIFSGQNANQPAKLVAVTQIAATQSESEGLSTLIGEDLIGKGADLSGPNLSQSLGEVSGGQVQSDGSIKLTLYKQRPKEYEDLELTTLTNNNTGVVYTITDKTFPTDKNELVKLDTGELIYTSKFNFQLPKSHEPVTNLSATITLGNVGTS